MTDGEVIRFKLDAGLSVLDKDELKSWLLDQLDAVQYGRRYEYVPDWVDPELGEDPKEVVIPDSVDSVFVLDDPVSLLMLLADLLLRTVPGIEEADSNWDVEWDRH